MKKLVWNMIAGLCIGLAGNVSAALLTNGGFEAGKGDYTGWTQFGNAEHEIMNQAWATYEGTNGFYIHGWKLNKDGGIYQDVSASAGNIYTLDAAIKVPTNYTYNGGTLVVSLMFLDGSDTELSHVSNAWDSVNGSTTNVYGPMATLQACAPLNTASARVKIHLTTDGFMENDFNPRNPMADSFVLTESSFGLLNGGFEVDNTFTNWTEFGGAPQEVATATWAASEGTNGVRMKGWNLNEDGGFYQDVPAAPVFNYTLNAHLKIGSAYLYSAGDSLTVALQCLDASDTLLDESSHVWSFGAGPATYDVFFAIDPLILKRAPEDTAKVRARVHWVTDGTKQGSGQESVMADVFSLTYEFVPQGTLIFIK
jgi:hypothetical protein